MPHQTNLGPRTASRRRPSAALILAAAGEGSLDLWRQETAGPKLIGPVVYTIRHRGDCPILKTLRDGKPRRVADEVFWRKDGTSFPVEYVSTPIIESGAVVGAVISFRNISKRREAEALVRESEARYRTIFNSSYDAIFVVDMSARHWPTAPRRKEIQRRRPKHRI